MIIQGIKSKTTILHVVRLSRLIKQNKSKLMVSFLKNVTNPGCGSMMGMIMATISGTYHPSIQYRQKRTESFPMERHLPDLPRCRPVWNWHRRRFCRKQQTK